MLWEIHFDLEQVLSSRLGHPKNGHDTSRFELDDILNVDSLESKDEVSRTKRNMDGAADDCERRLRSRRSWDSRAGQLV